MRAGTVEDALHRAARVPVMERFPTVDEPAAAASALARAHPGLVHERRVGTSRLGEPLLAYAVGDGPAQHLVVGGVHPNEPVGSCTALHLLRDLSEDEPLRRALGATWHVVPCLDPDGMRLNEGWFAGPPDRGRYARHFYRPAPDEQVEWTFPFAHRGHRFDRAMPETLALMGLIDALRPWLMVTLHNAELGGVYYYASRPLPGLVDALHALPRRLGLPLHRGQPEEPSAPVWAEAVYGMPPLAAVYDDLERLGVDAASVLAGSSSAEHASRYGTLSLVAEVPCWSHPAAADGTPSGRRHDEVLRTAAAALAESGDLLAALLAAAEPLLGPATPFLRAARAFVPVLGQAAAAQRARADSPEHERPATVAEAFTAEDLVRCYRLRYGGTLVRALGADVAAGTAPAPLRRLHEQACALFERWLADAARLEGAVALPVATAVGVQHGATLAAAALLARGDAGS